MFPDRLERPPKKRCSDQERLQIGRTDSREPNILPLPELDSTLSPSEHPRRLWRPRHVWFAASADVRSATWQAPICAREVARDMLCAAGRESVAPRIYRAGHFLSGPLRSGSSIAAIGQARNRTPSAIIRRRSSRPHVRARRSDQDRRRPRRRQNRRRPASPLAPPVVLDSLIVPS